MLDNYQLARDELFIRDDVEKLWQKYCGFLDLSLSEFMTIQGMLLTEQIDLLMNSVIGQKILGEKKPKSIEEFRQNTPLTRYNDYEPFMSQKNEKVLPVKPVIWAHTSGMTGSIKWIPYTAEILGRLADDTLSAFILSSANTKGEVRVHIGDRVVLNLPPVPYLTGIMSVAAYQRLPYQAIPPLEEAQKMEFEQRIQEGFKIALHTGIDYAASIAVVLAKVGEAFGQLGDSTRLTLPTYHPLAIGRMLLALLKSKVGKRPLLPRDLWKVKGLVCGGTDISIYRKAISYYWGVQPLDVYVSTETCFIAMQGWNKKGMTFIPYSNFYEFIPEAEWLKSRENPDYRPATVLMDEVEEGKIYEIVITNFHGGPLVRYRIGDLIKIVALKDDEMGVHLPQMSFQSRADDIIDIAGFARLDEKTIWQAIQNLDIPFVDWSARKEHSQGKSVINIYLELSGKNIYRKDELEHLIDSQLITLNDDYRDFRKMTGDEPLMVTLLSKGAFQRYQQQKAANGFDIAHLKPPHINSTDSVLKDLLSSSQDS